MAKNKWWNRKKNRKKKDNELKGNEMPENKVDPIESVVVHTLSEEEIEKAKREHDKGGAFKEVAARQNCWDSGIEILPSCGHMNIPAYHIQFNLLAHQKINKLKAYYPSLEWLAYLVGEVDHENHVVAVEDLVIPDSQQVTTASVYNVEYTWSALPDNKHIIGVIHSHHSMGAFFSGTDDAYINQNHDVSIVVATAKGREIKSQVRVKTPCNSYVLAEDITYSVKYPQVMDEKEFEKEFSSKINTYTPVVDYIGGMGRYLGGSKGNHYGRYSGNPPRGYQMDLYEGYDTTVWGDIEDDFEDDFEDPFSMTVDDLRDYLSDYYDDDEVEEFINEDTAADELSIIQDLIKKGIEVPKTSTDLDRQSGIANVSRGVPLKDQENDGSVWTTDDVEDEVIVQDFIHTKDGVFLNPNEARKSGTIN